MCLLVLCPSCARPPDEGDRAPDAKPAAFSDPASLDTLARCYRATSSILARSELLTGGRSTAPGWVRLEEVRSERETPSDSGAALLVDADGAALPGRWRREGLDSTAVVAFDDFLRVELRLAAGESLAAGTAIATSDAALERDESGRLRDFRREWSLRALRAPCDSMPRPWHRQASGPLRRIPAISDDHHSAIFEPCA